MALMSVILGANVGFEPVITILIANDENSSNPSFVNFCSKKLS